MTGLVIEAPSDAQLAYITRLCAQRGLCPPEAVASFKEAGEIIDAIKAGKYDPTLYEYPWLPFR